MIYILFNCFLNFTKCSKWIETSLLIKKNISAPWQTLSILEDFEKARLKRNEAEYTSDVNSVTENEVTQGKRKRRFV